MNDSVPIADENVGHEIHEDGVFSEVDAEHRQFEAFCRFLPVPI